MKSLNFSHHTELKFVIGTLFTVSVTLAFVHSSYAF